MANSICLSTDMNEIYLIDASGVTTFVGSLTGNGVLVSLDVSGNLSATIATSAPRGGDFEMPVTNSQWALSYHTDNKHMYVIGIVDVDVSRSEAHEYPLGTGQVVQVLRSGENLIIDKV